MTFVAATYVAVMSLVILWSGLGYFPVFYGESAIYTLQIYILCDFSAIFVVHAMLYEKELALAELNEKIEHDPLTGLFNRTRLRLELDRELQRFSRYETECALIMFDIDHFKRVNDTYGHEVGGEVLESLSIHVKKLIRTTDTLCRWGGEEFLLLLPQTGTEKARVLAERIRTSVMQEQLVPQQKITISLGVTMLRKGDDQHEVLARVDAAMYQAKQQGRNLVCVA